MTERKPGHREGIRKDQRYGQQTLDVGKTVEIAHLWIEEWSPLPEPTEDESFIATCQSCGLYWDVRQHKTCPATRGDGHRCNGYLG